MDPSWTRQLECGIRAIVKKLDLQLSQPVGPTLQAEHARDPFVVDRGHPHAVVDVEEYIDTFETGHCVSDRVEPEVEVAGVALLEVVLALQFGGVAVVEGTGFGHEVLMVAELDALYLGEAFGQ